MTRKSRITVLVMLLIGLEVLRRLAQTRRVAEEASLLAEEVHATDRQYRDATKAAASDDAPSATHTAPRSVPDSENDPAHAPGHRHLAPPPSDLPPQRASTRADKVWQPGPLR